MVCSLKPNVNPRDTEGSSVKGVNARLRQHRWTAEKHSDFGVGMFVRDGREDSVPIRPAKVGRRTQRSNRILFRADVLNHDIGHVIFLDLRSEIDANLDPVVRILLLDCMQQ